MSILKVQNLTKNYGKGDTLVKAVDDVSFTVEKKEFIENIDKLEQIENLIYKKSDYDVKCAYKIGFLEGLKLIALKDKI